jgi:hypothetical protein
LADVFAASLASPLRTLNILQQGFKLFGANLIHLAQDNVVSPDRTRVLSLILL